MGIYVKLAKIQEQLNVPKSREIFMKKGKVNYRKYEDIMKALKPLLHENKVCIYMSDEIEAVAPDRVYIKSTLRLVDLETEEIIENTAYAREEDIKEEDREGAVAKRTLSVSCYARKSALVALFCIDDSTGSENQNSSSDNKQQQENNLDDEEIKKEIATFSRQEMLQFIYKNMKEKNIAMREICGRYNAESLESICDTSLGKVCFALYKSKPKEKK